MDELPLELLALQAQYLDYNDLLNLCQSNKTLYQICQIPKTWYLLAHRLGYIKEDFGYRLTLEEAKQRYRYLATLFAIDAGLIPLFSLSSRNSFDAKSRYFQQQEMIKQNLIKNEIILQNNFDHFAQNMGELFPSQIIEYEESDDRELEAKKEFRRTALEYKQFKLPGYKMIKIEAYYWNFDIINSCGKSSVLIKDFLHDVRAIDITNAFTKIFGHSYCITRGTLRYKVSEINHNTLKIEI